MKKKYYLILDTETATLPFANQICSNAAEKQKIAIAKPLVYDIGWVIIDRQGNILKSVNYLVQETFFVPNVFNTAYYCDKRPIYMDMLEQGKIMTANWNDIINALLADLHMVDISAAYNAAFDFKKAIPFTERYMKHLYSSDYNEWERKQYGSCKAILKNGNKAKNEKFLDPVFELRGEQFPITDLWGIACDRLINIDKYRNYCLQNELLTASGMYFKTSAETTFQYLMNQYDFEESHTALDDAMIEAQILHKALKKGKVEPYFEPFPFQMLGTTANYALTKKPKYIPIVINVLEGYVTDKMPENGLERGYWKSIVNTIKKLERTLDSPEE